MPMQISIPRMAIWKKIEIFQIQDGGRTPYWKSFFGYISAPYWQIYASFGMEMKNHMQLDQNGNFRKFKMADRRHFENNIISISQPRIIRFRSNSVGRCKLQFPWWSFDKTIEIFQIQDGGRTRYWKLFFGYISAPYWPIYASFGMEMKNHMHISVAWPKWQFSQMQDGGRSPFWK